MNIPAGEDWHAITENNDVAAAVEGRLYVQGDIKRLDPRYLIHVRVFNKTKHRLGLDLGRADQVIYPNIWQFHRATERPVIIEARAEPNSITSAVIRKMTTEFNAGRLTFLTEFVDYYCRFNTRNPGGGDYSGNERYLTISTDGQLLYTDGMTVGRLDLQWREQLGPRQTDVVIPIPYHLSSLPSGALVLDAPPNPTINFQSQ